MTEIITGVKNTKPFYYFEQISKIPRGSGNEGRIAGYLQGFAFERGLECIKDKDNNVLITKSATQGRENEEPVLLQAHTDMVCEKNKDSIHDFSTEPIKLIQEGNILRADGTTLGADDGFGVACMLAILDSDSISHPRLECLFTSSEEIGLVGASLFDYSNITSRRLINLDSAEEDTVIIGCCGGVRTELTCPMEYEYGDFDAYRISVGGLYGGHSGEDIDKNRLNANILIGRIIKFLTKKAEIRISEINGGDKDNAIPRECEALITSDTPLDNIIEDMLTFAKEHIRAKEDSALTVRIEKTFTDRAFSVLDTKNIIKALSVANGVLHYRTSAPILPKVSRNLARIRTSEKGVSIGFSSRSYLEKELENCTAELDEMASAIGGSTYHHERYPGWESPKSSRLVRAWAEAYRKINGGEPNITLIHAGLECGIITSSVPDMTAISVGCNVHDLHTPFETMEIDSMDRMYDIIIAFLKGA